MTTFLTLKEVAKKRGVSPMALRREISAGLFPGPIKREGRRWARWLEHEATTINAAIIRGDDDETIRGLVRELITLREAVGIKAP